MNSNLLGEQIARFRKALGMTQEDLGKAVGISAQAVSRWECGGAPDVTLLPAVADTLGVTVDALFGREGGEKVDIEDAVRRWMLTIPWGQRVDKLCRLIWNAAGPAMSTKPGDIPDISGYESCCETENPEDEQVRWLRRTRISMEDGLILGVRADDMSFAAVFPEPEAGWEAFMEDNGVYRRLFEVLARPHCLELLEYLHSKPPLTLRRCTPGAAARQMDLEAGEVERLMEALTELKILSKSELETEEGLLCGYLLSDEEALVPLLYLARWMVTGGSGYLNAPYRRTPILRGEKWKETWKREN